MPQRRNPEHWIWSVPLAPRFTPDEGPYLAVRTLCAEAPEWCTTEHITDLIAEGMSAEQLVALFNLDDRMPPDVVQVVGNGLAYWVQRAQEAS